MEDEQRRHLAESFPRAEVPYAVDTWRTVEQELEHHAEAWATARVAAVERGTASATARRQLLLHVVGVSS